MRISLSVHQCMKKTMEEKNKRTMIVIKKLSAILLYEMGKDELTIEEMSKKCGISKRKLCEIIYIEEKGLNLETFLTICENIGINYADIL